MNSAGRSNWVSQLLEHFREKVLPDPDFFHERLPAGLDVDLPALRGHVVAIDATTDMLESLLRAPEQIAAIARERRGVASELMAAVAEDRPFDATTRHAYGMLTVHHETAIRRHILAGRLSADEAVSAAWDGATLRLLLGEHRLEVPLVFETTLGVATRQSLVEEHGIRFDEAFDVPTSRGCYRLLVSNGVELWRATALSRVEPETVDWLERTITSNSVVFDVGANIGGITLYAWRLGAAQVVSFEPEPLNFARLTQNLRLNDAQSVLALPLAISERAEVARFSYRDFAAGAASPHALDAASATARRFQASCYSVPLDTLKQDPLIRRPTHLKIDVDGQDLEVLRGAVDTLREPTLAHLLVELHKQDAVEALPLLAGLDFRHVGGRPHGAGVANYIFQRW